jgi:hypothetical protein
MSLLLDRIAVKVAARRDEVFQEVKARNPDDLDSAYQAAINRIRWGDSQDLAITMDQAEMEELVSALECFGPFGPVKKAAVDLAASLTGTSGLLEHKLEVLVRFSSTLPDQVKGSIAAFKAKLGFGIGLHASYQRHAKIYAVTAHDTAVELNEGYVTIRGELTFTMDICNDGDIPAAQTLKDLLSVTISAGASYGIPEKFERTVVRELQILSVVTR